MLKVVDLYYAVHRYKILNGISLQFKPGHFSMIIGPNGSGKSTLLKNISGDLQPSSGSISYGKLECSKENLKRLATMRATLSQQTLLSFPMTVEEVVMMGRYPHFEFKPGKKDKEIVHLALKKLNMVHLKDNNYLTLSGGEKQRVNFAKVLAQLWEPVENETRYLLLDEPIASLDPNYQHEFLTIASEWAAMGVTVVAVMHDINLACQYGNYFVALKSGHVLAEGIKEKVMNESVLSQLYDISCIAVRTEAMSEPMFIFQKKNSL